MKIVYYDYYDEMDLTVENNSYEFMKNELLSLKKKSEKIQEEEGDSEKK